MRARNVCVVPDPCGITLPAIRWAFCQVGLQTELEPEGAIGAREAATERIDIPEFLRLFQLRTHQVMWFLGAGASLAAGIPTANDIIWDCKERLYRSIKRLAPSAITDIGDPVVRRKLQAFFDETGRYPRPDAEDEYSAYFEATYPSPRDRRAYLDNLMARGKPSFGHLAMALLMREGLCRAVWTTNFDRVVEDAAARLLGSTSRLVVADLSEPAKLGQAWAAGRWPAYAKLHGDYHSEHLKNTAQELREQDREMRNRLVAACRQQGLAVVGYSGRDASIMEALTEAVEGGGAFPAGLFWFVRGSGQPFAAVGNLIALAKSRGVEAHLVELEGFDELLLDVVRFLPETANKLADLSHEARPRLAAAKVRPGSTTLPAVRTNALPITRYPTVCRRVTCKIGGQAEVRAAVEAAGVEIVAQRSRDGVLAFGRDADVRQAFDPFGVEDFDTRAIDPRRLAFETGERAVLRDALFRAIGRRPGLRVEQHGRVSLVVPDPKVVQARVFTDGVTRPLDVVAGVVPRTRVGWTEACAVRLDCRLGRLWLLLEPRVKIVPLEGAREEEIDAAREFVRKRRTARHNKAANAVLEGWATLVAGDDRRGVLRLKALELTDGIDAEFEMVRVSGFSGRAR